MRLCNWADHRGAASAKQLADRLRSDGHDVIVAGSLGGATTDYPDAAFAVGPAITYGQFFRQRSASPAPHMASRYAWVLSG